MKPLTNTGALVENCLEVLGEDEEKIFCRVRSEGESGRASTLLMVAATSEHPLPGLLERLAREVELSGELHSKWAVRPIEIVRERGRTMLMLDDPGGEPLARLLGKAMEPGQFLNLAIGIAMALGELHGRGLVHKDIKPANIMVNCLDGRVRLTGFGLASYLPRERQNPDPPEAIAGTLAYMAPEQTGRMNRSIDARSDLYSFGVTLYEMLTGSLPFTASDPMEWVHCHVARKPVAPAEGLGKESAHLSTIVLKLLAKTAEERYQSARGVEKDLRRCLDSWERRACVDPFPVGEHDAPSRLLIPESVYGRRTEVETLLGSFDRVAATGKPELVLVSGYSGIGKSSVVEEFHRAHVLSRGLFASGKFDQYKRGIPYGTLAQALQNLVRELLAKNDHELARWRDALIKAVGQNGQLMINLIPELAIIIGEQPSVPDLLPTDAQSRFQMVFRRLLGVFARSEHPLVIFLDDLQWLDAATLGLVADLLVHPDVEYLLLVGAYRGNEVTPDHQLTHVIRTVRASGARVHDIRLGPLRSQHVEELIADALRQRRGYVRPLARLVLERTGGNPFFVIHFLTELVAEGVLTFDASTGSWAWDLPRIHGKGFTDNVADLMAAKLGRLPPATQEALEEMACLGNVIHAAKLAMIRGETELELRSALWPAVGADLIIFQDGTYRFLHDRIHEAAYARILKAGRASTHLRIGRVLLTRTVPEELDASIFEIVDQFLRGVELLYSEKERHEVAVLNLIAGKRAKTATAYVSALRYLSAGRALLPRDAWERYFRLTFDLELNLAECEFLTGDFASAEERLASLSRHALDPIDLAVLTRLLIDLHVTQGDMDRAIRVGLDYMRRIDPEWPPNITADDAQREYDRLSKQLREIRVETLLDLPQMTDPDQRAKMDVLAALQSPALFGGESLRQFMICRMVAICLEHGNSDGAPVAYVLFGSIQGMFFGDYQAGARLAEVGLELVARPGFERFRARVYSKFAVHVSNWSQPLDVARTYLRRAFEAAQESGDISFAAFSCVDMITNLLAAGTPLNEVEREAEQNREIVKGLRFDAIRRSIAQQLTVIRMLRGQVGVARSFSEAVLEADQYEDLDSGARSETNEKNFLNVQVQGHRSLRSIGAIRELQARTFMQDFAAGLEAVTRNPPLWSVPTQFERAEYQFYEALSRTALSDSTTGEERQAHLEAAVEHYRQLAIWAENFPPTFESRAALVGAEVARLEGQDPEAQRLYERAIRSAREHGFVQNEALAYEVAARFYADRGFMEFADLYLRNARRCYVSWGAEGKARQLDQRYSQLRDHERAADAKSTIGAPVEHLDLATVIKVSQSVSGEIILDRLLDTIMRTAIEQAGAEWGLLIIARGTELRVAVEARTNGDAILVQLRDEPVSAAGLPVSVLNYVLHTKESVIVENATGQNQFSDDPYIRERQARSILCLPLLNQAKLIGVLYLENNLIPSAFAPARIPTLKLLASQAAISLTITRLYSDLAEREAKIRRLVDANIIGIFIWDFDGRIIEANDAFLQIVGYGRADLMAGGISWEKLAPSDWREQDASLLQLQRSTGFLEPFEKEYFRKDGQRVPVLIGVATLEEGGNEGVAFVLDLTERKRAEAQAREHEQRIRDMQTQLAHANRVATMGQLTASFTHEVSQPVTAVLANAAAAKRWLGNKPPDLCEVEQALDGIVKGSVQARDILDRMRALFRKASLSTTSLDVNEALDEVVALTRAEAAKSSITVRTELASDLPRISGDRVQIQQVLLNLIMNAIEAMREVDEGTRDLRISTRSDGSNSIIISVDDTGPGLRPDTIKHVFDPFYTTKSSGLGLGLSVCHSIVEAHGGRLWASANARGGATFQFALPGKEERCSSNAA